MHQPLNGKHTKTDLRNLQISAIRKPINFAARLKMTSLFTHFSLFILQTTTMHHPPQIAAAVQQRRRAV